MTRSKSESLSWIEINARAYLAQDDLNRKVKAEMETDRNGHPVLVIRVGRRKNRVPLADLVEYYDTTDWNYILEQLADDPELIATLDLDIDY